MRSFGSCSLRLLLLLTTVCCIGLAVWRVAIRPYQRQARAAKAIGEIGGTTRIEPSRTWLARVFGQRHFNDVIEVDLQNHDDGSEYANHLAAFPRLQTLRVGINFGDEEMRQLRKCTELRRLFFQRTQVTDGGLKVCENFPELRLVELGRNITDDGLEVLKGKKRLAYVDLSHTQVTDRGLEHLRGLPSLHKVRLNFRPITDAGLEAILTLPKLDELYLIGCKQISDDGFRSLTKKTLLKQLDVKQTNIDESTIRFLDESLGQCRVLREWRPAFY